MAGHSHWANIKHKKAKVDAVRGRQWSKLARAVIVAARNGGGDPDMNLALRYAIDEARAVNMPRDTIEKAIKKGTGELGAESYTALRYEGYGPGGVAIMADCLTDNLNRTAPEIRLIFERHGGKLGVTGSVAFGFAHRGRVLVEESLVTEERLMEMVLEAGAEDYALTEGFWEILTPPAALLRVKQALVDAGIAPESVGLTMIPSLTVPCRGEEARAVLRIVEGLEDNDDVQKVYANFEIPEEELARLQT